MKGFWTLRRAAKAVGVQCPNDLPLTGVSTDTRTIERGALFVALRGEQFDAHNFLTDAVARGAAALVVDDGEKAAGLGVPALVVPNTLTALGELGSCLRTAWSRPVIAVGGSNGKTTTKELIRATLSATLDVHATTGNLNNQIGVPQTLLALTEDADIAVVEVGTNTPGEIAILRRIVRPDIAVVTTVQEEHLEGFGDLAGVMTEELSLTDGVQLAVVPASEPAVVAEAVQRAQNVVAAGLVAGDVRADEWGLGGNGRGWIRLGGVRIEVPAPGAHNAANAMLAIAVGRACGVGDADIARGMATAKFPPMRSSVAPLGDALLVNDAYNANPGSMRTALTLLEAVRGDRPMVVVLGTMRELGARAASLHDDIAKAALATRAEVIGAVGEFAAAFARVAPKDPRVVSGSDPEAIWPLLAPRLNPRAAILLKASRGVRLERLLPKLSEWAGVPIQRPGTS
jgi:UDP-N-acetylmuramoyl-tripeptide--D-alanyl-D-alanine ligase